MPRALSKPFLRVALVGCGIISETHLRAYRAHADRARVTEYFDVSPMPGNGQLIVVTTIVDDPRYLTQQFIVSSQFKKEADGSKWDPTPCSSTW